MQFIEPQEGMTMSDTIESTGAQRKGAMRAIQPGEAPSLWQPVPANGHIDVIFAPSIVAMEHPMAMGTQTVPAGSHVREHAHDRNEEIIYFLKGQGKAVVEGEEIRLMPGTSIFLGKNQRHMFVNDGMEDMQFMWILLPNGLEDFFAQIGRPRSPGDPVPENFPRPENVLEIERNTVFAPQPADQRKP